MFQPGLPEELTQLPTSISQQLLLGPFVTSDGKSSSRHPAMATHSSTARLSVQKEEVLLYKMAVKICPEGPEVSDELSLILEGLTPLLGAHRGISHLRMTSRLSGALWALLSLCSLRQVSLSHPPSPWKMIPASKVISSPKSHLIEPILKTASDTAMQTQKRPCTQQSNTCFICRV